MKKFRMLILIAINLSLIGCASGPAFKPVNPIPEGKGVVYIYIGSMRSWALGVVSLVTLL